ncbi:FAD-binding oxidoreductase [Candidatus Dependentiae bacterium]|nr:FAD-binding oxidoreductase [Candidatus Dependentiae bacterium]
MKMSPFLPQDQVFWYIAPQTITPLEKDIVTDVLVIGGGMAGLMAAQSFHKRGLKVVLLEKNYCGSGATGKSSGFITPNSELSLNDLILTHGEAEAKRIWEFGASGVESIRTTLEEYTLDCDYQKQDTLVVAHTQKAFASAISTEHTSRESLQYESTLYSKSELPGILGSHQYEGGISYGGSFGIHPYRYCRGLKDSLQNDGVQIYEETPALAIENNLVKTPRARVKAEHIVVCIDRFAHSLPTLFDKVYHVQTFIMLSAPLTQTQIKKIFPHDPYMVWDTALVYNYYRLTGDNRLIVGGSDLLHSYVAQETHNATTIMKKLTRSFNEKFPGVEIEFEYIWPGLIGVTKDLFPIAGHDRTMPSVYYAVGSTGLPWAAALGAYSAEAILDKNSAFDEYLSPYRSCKLGPLTQRLLGARLTFALSNLLTVTSI